MMLERPLVTKAFRCALAVGIAISLAACDQRGLFASRGDGSGAKAEISGDVKFSSSVYGVPASPRLTDLRQVRKGGGRPQLGKPYKVRGVWYHPKDDPDYVGEGLASWYGPNFHGRLTANGEIYDMHMLSAAHKTFPLPSYAWVTNAENGRRVMVRVNDRGPFAEGREIDVSRQAAEVLGFKTQGIAEVEVEYIGRAPVNIDDSRMLMATFQPGHGNANSIMVASSAGGAGSVALAYAAEAPDLPGAGTAIAGMLRSERVNLGLVDLDTFAEIREAIPDLVAGAMPQSSPIAGMVTAEFRLPSDENADELLERLWALGAHDAFISRD